MPLSTNVALPEAKTWELFDKKSNTVRTFEQSELSIEGEVRLVQLAGATVSKLTEMGFPWAEVTKVFTSDGDILWDKASDMLMLAITEVPELVAESTCTLFGLFPLDENGNRNKDYDQDKLFVKRSISFTKWIEILTVFSEQNDYQRLARPFSMAMTRALEVGMLVAQEQQARSSLNSVSSPESTDSLSQDTEASDIS